MDEIDLAIAEVEARKAAQEAKRARKKRATPTNGHVEGIEGEKIVTTEAQSKELRSNAPASKKQRLPKKGQFKAYKALYGNDLHPTFKLHLENMKCDEKYLGMKDLHQLMVSIVGSGPAVNWADIPHQSRIGHVYLIVLDSLSHELFLEASVSGLMPFLTSQFHSAPAKAPGNSKRVYDGVSVLLRHPMSKSIAKSVKKAHESTLASLASLGKTTSEATMDVSSENTQMPDTSPSTAAQVIEGPAITKETLQSRFSTSKALSDKSLHTEITQLTPGQVLLTPRELEANLYPLPHTITESGFIEIPKYKEPEHSESTEAPKYHLLAIDCEMCRTSDGIELTRVVVINTNLQVVYDSYVKPEAQVTDYLTRYSGITKEILDPVTVRLPDVQQDLLKLITPKTILIGHSLENDLKALKLSHFRVIDTALMYPHTRGDTFKNSLKFLAENWLNESIQNDHGHDPTQDAKTAMKLALLKLKNGENFGKVALADKEENFCEYLYRLGKRTCITDNLSGCKSYAGSHTDLNAEEDDEMITSKAQRSFTSCTYEFAYARLRALEKYYTSLERYTDTPSTASEPTDATNSETENSTQPSQRPTLDNPVTPLNRETERQICAKMDQQLQQMMTSLPKKCLVIVTGGHGNLARIRSINNIRQRAVNSGSVWTESDDAKSRIAFEKARETITFFHIPPATPPTSKPQDDTSTGDSKMDISTNNPSQPQHSESSAPTL